LEITQMRTDAVVTKAVSSDLISSCHYSTITQETLIR